jgi:hypothetical protein
MSAAHSDIESPLSSPNIERILDRDLYSLSNTHSDSGTESDDVPISIFNMGSYNPANLDSSSNTSEDHCIMEISGGTGDSIHNIETNILNSSIDSITNDECIICMEKNNLSENCLCANMCKFKYHIDCYIEWLAISNVNVCLLCKNPILRTLPFNISNNSYLEDEVDIESYNQSDDNQSDDNPPDDNPPDDNRGYACTIYCRNKFDKIAASREDCIMDLSLCAIIFIMALLLFLYYLT